MSSQIKAWSEGHWTRPDTTNQNKVSSTESEYAVVNKRRSPNVSSPMQGTQPSVGMNTSSPLQVTRSSVGMNLQNNNAQDHIKVDKQKIIDGLSRQKPENKFDNCVVPKESGSSNNASNAFRHSVLPNSREEEQFQDRSKQTPRVAVDSAWDSQPDKHETSQEDPNHLVKKFTIMFIKIFCLFACLVFCFFRWCLT